MSVLNEFKKLSFKNEQEENDFIDYCTNIISSKISGPVPNSHIIIPEKRTYILLKYFCRGNKYFFLGNKCFDVDFIENLSIETLKVGEREEDFENIFECHVIDGIKMGNIERPKKISIIFVIYKGQLKKNDHY